tara:strand:- start:1198 stop:1344 length:147 start_codon:yes stop_codon:yes gene_type:complete
MKMKNKIIILYLVIYPWQGWQVPNAQMPANPDAYAVTNQPANRLIENT